MEKLKKMHWYHYLVIESIAIVIAFLFVVLILEPFHYEEFPPSSQPFEINAVDHEITNLSDMYIGFEFDNSTFTVNIDITNDSIYIYGIQSKGSSTIKLKVNNETKSTHSGASGSGWPDWRYVSWKVVNLQYGETVTFSFSGKGRAIVMDTRQYL